MPNYIAYYRVSTDKQGANGLGMDAQRQLTLSYANLTIAEYVEVESGRKNNRPELQKALTHAKTTGSTLLIAKLDRLARNVHFISGLMEAGIDFIAADMPQANKLTLHIMAAFAEHEAEQISARTKAALAAAKARGVRLGGYRGPILGTADGLRASQRCRTARASAFCGQIGPVVANIRACGAKSLREIALELTRRGYKAPRGGEWSANQVRRISVLTA